jgi:hypothetical protein
MNIDLSRREWLALMLASLPADVAAKIEATPEDFKIVNGVMGEQSCRYLYGPGDEWLAYSLAWWCGKWVMVHEIKHAAPPQVLLDNASTVRMLMGGDLLFTLEPALDDRKDHRSAESELQQLHRSLADAGASITSLEIEPGRAYNISRLDLLARFVVDLEKFAMPAASLLVGWLTGRNGRKARVKVGDIEAEARTPEELERLLKRALEIRAEQEPKRIQKP